jgi:non-ribosomal peptide synthase protein (TIGR01720 family)
VEITLSEDVSQRLLQQAHTPFRTRGNELFIAALRIAYADWNPWQPLELLLEGHGREAALSDLDISRTVGWFTSVHPAYFSPARIGPPDADLIRETKEYLRSVPRNGAGFGWLQATGAALFSPERLSSAISFNFLGAFESGAGAFALSAERPVGVRAGNQPVDHSIAIMGYVAGGRMYWSVEYDSVRWPEITMQGLLGRFIQVLGEVAACTAATPAVVPSPADFVFHRLKLEAFDRMVARREWPPATIEDIYPLSPMQKGLFLRGDQSAFFRGLF